MLFRLVLPVFISALAPCAAASPPDTLPPRRVMERFDSLLNAGNADADSQAKALCVGTALRVFSFLAEAEHKLSPYVDSARSRDTVVEEKCRGRWCGLKVVSDAVFRRPLMGMENMHSIQVARFFHSPGGWKLAEFEELPDERAPWDLPSGALDESGAAAQPLFPVSKQAPDPGRATRMRLRVSLGSGDSLPDLPQGPGQRVLQRGKDWAWIETQAPPVPVSGGEEASQNDSLKAYLGSGFYLDLTDTLLLAKAAQLRKGAKDPAEIARRVYGFVTSSFHFKLGAALFDDSRTSLRSLEGDCSEAAVLTAALLRAEGIPSRVDLGFATLGRGVFIGHAWSEAFIAGRWIGVDAALREFPAGAQRVALLRLSGSEDMQVAASNMMLQSLSNLDIEITDAWAGSQRLPLREQHGNAEEGKEFFEEILRGVGNDKE